MGILEKLVGSLFGGSGVASGFANIAKGLALAPVLLWLLEHKEGHAVTLTYGYAGILVLFVLALLHVAHHAEPGELLIDPAPGRVASVVVTVVKFVLVALCLWIITRHKADVLYALTWGELALGGAVVYALVSMAHLATPPSWHYGGGPGE